jgi:hypothetical protein
MAQSPSIRPATPDELVAEVAPHTRTQRALDRSEFIASAIAPTALAGGFFALVLSMS